MYLNLEINKTQLDSYLLRTRGIKVQSSYRETAHFTVSDFNTAIQEHTDAHAPHAHFLGFHLQTLTTASCISERGKLEPRGTAECDFEAFPLLLCLSKL